MRRLFIAVDLPDDRTRALTALRDDELPARWTPAEQLHITLRFIGEAGEAAADELRRALRHIDAGSFTLSGSGLDVFPSRRRPRVLVARIGEAPPLAALQAEVERVAQAQGFAPEKKPFNPHVTFARLKRARPRDVRQFLKSNAGVTIEPFEITAFHLYRSDLLPTGAEHTVLESYELGAEERA